MAVRKVITSRQWIAAHNLVVEGMTGYRALTKAGFGNQYARHLGKALDKSWGLREAIRQTREGTSWAMNPRPQRRRRYDHKRVVDAIRNHALVEPLPVPSGEDFADLRRRTTFCPFCERDVVTREEVDTSGMHWKRRVCPQGHTLGYV